MHLPSWVPPPGDRIAIGAALGMFGGITLASIQQDVAAAGPSWALAVAWLVGAVGVAVPLLAVGARIAVQTIKFFRESGGGGGSQTTVVTGRAEDAGSAREEGRDAGVMLERISQLATNIERALDLAAEDRATMLRVLQEVEAHKRVMIERIQVATLASEAALRGVDGLGPRIGETQRLLGELAVVVIPAARARLAEDRAKRVKRKKGRRQ